MPDIETKRIDELPVATGVGNSDLFVVEQSGVAKSIEGSVLRSNFSQEVDSTLSATSENPVQNKVVKDALDGKADRSALDGKVDKVSGKGLSANDYTTTEKNKLAGIQAGAQVNPDLSGYATKTEMNTALGGKADSSALAAKADKITEIAVATGGAVTQVLEAGKWYHFTGALTSLTITLTTPASGELAQYHFDFTSGATAPTVTIPNTVTMPDGFSVEANKRYEVDILNNYGAVMTWAVS